MNKKRSRYKNILELTERLLDFIRLFNQILLFFILAVFEQTCQRRSYFRITIYKALIKVNEFQKYLHFAIDFELRLFFNHLNLFRIHLYFFYKYYEA